MTKAATDLPTYQRYLLDKAKAMEAHRQSNGEGAARGDDEAWPIRAWPSRTWVISDGTAGMLSQGLALTRAMGIRGEDIRAVPTPLLRGFPRLANLPGWQLTLGRKPDWLKANQWPDLCITCGRRMAGISIGVRRLAGGRTKTIHIQDPHIDPRYFDLMITPKHDDIAQKMAAGAADIPNLLTTTGALNRLDAAEIGAAAAAVKAACCGGPDGPALMMPEGDGRKLAAVMVGGHNRRYRVGARELTKLAEELAAFAQATGAALAIVPSRRTPKRGLRVLTDQLHGQLGAQAARVWVWDGGSPNPYPGLLGLADYVIVTSDSVNMTSEAALTGKPVLTAEMAAETGRIATFHQMMQDGRHTARLAQVLARPERLNEAFVVLDERASIGEEVYRFFEGG